MIENRFALGQSACVTGEGDSVLWSDVSPCVVCCSETVSPLPWMVTSSLGPDRLCSDWLSVTVVLSVSLVCPVLSSLSTDLTVTKMHDGHISKMSYERVEITLILSLK